MRKRDFLLTAGTAGLGPLAAEAATPKGGSAQKQPALLTVSGAIGTGNRGPLDPVIDQMMHKHGIAFTKAFAFTAEALQKLPSVTIRPTLEYDGKPHPLEGPLLATVLEAAGVKPGAAVQLGLRAVDGYNVAVKLADVVTWKMIAALRIDGQPLSLGGFGPQWAVYDADNTAPFKDKPVAERFGLCPWGLYHIDVKPV